jgi:HEAT repeat protein
VLERIADLLCRMGDDLIELGEPRLAAGIFEAQSVRRRQLAGDAASALERFPNASSKRLLFDALRGGGRSGEHALGVLASLDALALPWLVEGICAVDELRPRHALARLVARCGGADRLRSELGRQTRPSARANLLSVMEVAGVRKVASEVTLGLADDDPEVRAAALALATRVRDSAVLELVLDEAGHPDRERSLAAIAELGDVHAHAATARLVGLLRAGDADRVTACARALGRSGAPGAAEPLAAELSRRNWRGRPLWPTSTRAALVEALAAIDTDAGRAALAAATDDADALVAHLAQAKLAADG